jgi:hypothetical protein
VDTSSPDGTPVEEPHYRLPGPLRHDGSGLPVAPTAPRVPRALRAFNGMPPAVDDPPPAATPARARGRESQRSIRDLLLDNQPEEDAGLMAGIRSAFGRLRRGRTPEDEEQ